MAGKGREKEGSVERLNHTVTEQQENQNTSKAFQSLQKRGLQGSKEKKKKGGAVPGAGSQASGHSGRVPDGAIWWRAREKNEDRRKVGIIEEGAVRL